MVRLSPRELDVLRQWSQDHTVAEIADRLFVSVNSVKSHLRSIYKKLNVTGRGDALERARQLALIP
nr:helix-turn-helix transcriptional regulator [Pseudactinotalea sp. HY160]